MQGARRLIDSRSFTYVPSNAAELKEYRRAINSLQSFYDEDLCMREGDEIPFNDFYAKYQAFCGQTGNRPFARNKIRALIRQLGLPLDVVSSMGNNRGIKAMQDINVVDGNENLPF